MGYSEYVISSVRMFSTRSILCLYSPLLYFIAPVPIIIYHHLSSSPSFFATCCNLTCTQYWYSHKISINFSSPQLTNAQNINNISLRFSTLYAFNLTDINNFGIYATVTSYDKSRFYQCCQ